MCLFVCKVHQLLGSFSWVAVATSRGPSSAWGQSAVPRTQTSNSCLAFELSKSKINQGCDQRFHREFHRSGNGLQGTRRAVVNTFFLNTLRVCQSAQKGVCSPSKPPDLSVLQVELESEGPTRFSSIVRAQEFGSLGFYQRWVSKRPGSCVRIQQ